MLCYKYATVIRYAIICYAISCYRRRSGVWTGNMPLNMLYYIVTSYTA